MGDLCNKVTIYLNVLVFHLPTPFLTKISSRFFINIILRIRDSFSLEIQMSSFIFT